MPHLRLGQTDITYRDTGSGSGSAVILLHSSSSHSGQWKPLIEDAGSRYRFLAPDFHGYGRSGPLPRDGRPYFEHDTAIVDRLIDTVGHPVHLVGHSLGGTIAARVALRNPDAVLSLTLIEPVLFCLLEETNDARRLDYLDLAHAVIVLTEFGEEERAARLFLDYWVGEAGFDALDDRTRAYVVQTIGRVADDWRGISMHTPGQIRLADFRGLSVPTSLLCASETRPAARAIVEHLREAIAQAEYREIDRAGHMAPATDPGAINPLIVDYLDRQSRERPPDSA